MEPLEYHQNNLGNNYFFVINYNRLSALKMLGVMINPSTGLAP